MIIFKATEKFICSAKFSFLINLLTLAHVWPVIRMQSYACLFHKNTVLFRQHSLQHSNRVIHKREQSYFLSNKNGHKTEPWGTPDLISVLSVTLLLILTI